MVSDNRRAKFLQELAESGIVAVAAKRIGISRSTVYEWVRKNEKFAKKFEKALEDGIGNWCDFSENQLHGLIKDKNLNAIKYFLDSNSKKYFKPRKPVDIPMLDNYKGVTSITYNVIEPGNNIKITNDTHKIIDT